MLNGLGVAACLLAMVATAAFGQFTSFGKNKVQYAEFEWQKMESEHFDVYFFEEEEALAAYAAQIPCGAQGDP